MLCRLILLIASPAFALAPDVEKAEAQFSGGDPSASAATLSAYVATHPDDAEALWRLARALYEKGELMSAQGRPDSERLPLYGQAQAYAHHAQEVAPDSGLGYMWEGVALGRVATSKGILSQLFTADDMEKLWLKALSTSSRYASASGNSTFPGDAYNALGQFYRLCPDWAAMKWIAGTRGDIDKSVDFQRRLVAAEPQRIEGAKELGVSLLCKGYKQGDDAAKAEGRTFLKMALELPTKTPVDRIDHAQLPTILAREADACEYSRDGYEDTSESAYKGK
jgi:tetratricopeptide (TPR) repeat protein